MKSICTKSRLRTVASRCGIAKRFGVAEIETLLVIVFILLPLLFLSVAAFTFGRARIGAAYNAQNDAYKQTISGQGLTTGTTTPIDGLNVIHPAGVGLPNRFAYANPTQNVTLNFGSTTQPMSITVEDRAIFLDPNWHIANFPHPGDQQQTRLWFESYVYEARTPELVFSLGLQPPGPP